MINRRQFLAGMAAVAAAAVSGPVVAQETNTDPHAKYREAIRLFDRCVAAGDRQSVNQRADQLLAFLRANFPVPEHTPEVRALVKDIISNRVNFASVRSCPPGVADSVYTVALMKMALSGYNLDLKPSLMREFDWFHRSYGPVILDYHD